MWYYWKDVLADIFVGLIFGAFWVLLAVGAGHYLPLPGPSYAREMTQLCVFMFGIGGLLMFQLTCWFTGVEIWTHGWVRKICSVVGANIACATPIIVAFMLI